MYINLAFLFLFEDFFIMDLRSEGLSFASFSFNF
jgi:hypothetical protein